MTSHYDWKNGKQTCPSCGWFGLGSDTGIGETFADGAEYHCPTCSHRFGYIAYPLLSESLSDPRAPASDRMFAEIATRGANPERDSAPPKPTNTAGTAIFSRVLLNNDTWLMTIRWLGLGKLEVSHFPSGRNAVAPNWLKSHFINTMHALSSLGVPIEPGSRIALQAMETYAKFVLDPEDLLARAALSQSPERLAQSIQQQLAP